MIYLGATFWFSPFHTADGVYRVADKLIAATAWASFTIAWRVGTYLSS